MEGFMSTLGALFVTGLTVGVGPCMLHCAPAVAFYVTGTAEGWRAGFKAAISFALARLAAHTLLGALAGGIGMQLVNRIAEEALAVWAQLGAAAFILLLGALIVMGRKSGVRVCRYLSRHTLEQSTISMALLGFLIGIVPYCAPFLGVLTYIAFALGDVGLGALCGLAFGLGAALITPLLIVGPAAGLLAKVLKTPILLGVLRRASGFFLLLFGFTLASAVVGRL